MTGGSLKRVFIYISRKFWRTAFAKFSKEHPTSAKIKTKARRSKKYQAECFDLSRKLHHPLNEEIFTSAFEAAMK